MNKLFVNTYPESYIVRDKLLEMFIIEYIRSIVGRFMTIIGGV